MLLNDEACQLFISNIKIFFEMFYKFFVTRFLFWIISDLLEYYAIFDWIFTSSNSFVNMTWNRFFFFGDEDYFHSEFDYFSVELQGSLQIALEFRNLWE